MRVFLLVLFFPFGAMAQDRTKEWKDLMDSTRQACQGTGGIMSTNQQCFEHWDGCMAGAGLDRKVLKVRKPAVSGMTVESFVAGTPPAEITSGDAEAIERAFDYAGRCADGIREVARACGRAGAQEEICRESFNMCIGDPGDRSRFQSGNDAAENQLPGFTVVEAEEPWVRCADHARTVASNARAGAPDEAIQEQIEQHYYHEGDAGIVGRLGDLVGGVFGTVGSGVTSASGWIGKEALDLGCWGVKGIVSPLTQAGLSTCFTCTAVWAVLRALGSVGEIGFKLLVKPAVLLGGVFFVLWATINMAQGAIGESRAGSPAEKIMTRGVIMAFVIMLLGISTGIGGVQSSHDFLSRQVVSPVLMAGMSAGTGLMVVGGGADPVYRDVVETAFREADDFVTDQEGKGFDVPGSLKSMAVGVMDFVALIHGAGRFGIAKGLTLMCDSPTAKTFVERLVGFVVGALVLLMYVMFLITAGLRLIDPVIRSVIVIALAPLLLMSAVFPSTRGAAIHGIRNVAWSAVYLMLLGLVLALAVMLIVVVMSSVMPPLTDVSKRSFTDSGLDIVGPIVALVVVILAQSLLGTANTIASSLVGGGGGAGVAEGAETQARGMFSKMVMVGATGTMAAVSKVGRIARSSRAGKAAGAASGT